MPRKVFQVTSARYLKSCSFDDLRAKTTTDDELRTASWVDVTHGEQELVDDTFEALDLHPLAIEACLESVPVSGLVAYGHTLFIGLPIQTHWDSEERTTLRIVCLPGVIVTVHDREIPALRHIAQRYCEGLRFHNDSASAILHQILDHVIDEDVAFTLNTRDAVDQLEDMLDDDELAEQTLPLKRHLSSLAATIEDQLYCVELLQAIESEAFSIAGLEDYFRDAIAHLEHASRSIGRQTAHLSTIQQEQQLKLQNQTNDRLRLLTVVSTIFLPLTLIVGIYGMNFRNMPELAWRYAYGGVLAAMLVVASVMLWGFYRAGWFR